MSKEQAVRDAVRDALISLGIGEIPDDLAQMEIEVEDDLQTAEGL